MTNNSGKFRDTVSHKAADIQNPGEVSGSEGLKNPPQNPQDGGYDFGEYIPDVPQDTMSKVKYYLGEWWWLWLVALLIYLAKRK